jgi:hypothetical protein
LGGELQVDRGKRDWLEKLTDKENVVGVAASVRLL